MGLVSIIFNSYYSVRKLSLDIEGGINRLLPD